ncbi:MAG: carbohydrate ABC transporter permease [Bacillota bacterium]
MNKVLGNKKYIAVFVLPTFALYTVFVLFPIVYNIVLSLFKTDLMSKFEFIGLDNYINLFRDGFFLMSLRNNLILVAGSLIAHLGLGLVFANALFIKIRGSEFFKTIFFLPVVICGAAVGIMFIFIYNSEFGLVNKFLELINLSQLKRSWLNETDTVMLALTFVVMWRFVGYHMVIQLAAMKSIPVELFEAASIDGVSQWQKFTKITFPLIKNIFSIDAVIVITGSLKYYDLIYAMTKGGPSHASEVLATYMYFQGFRNIKFGYASAIGTVMLLLCILTIWLVNRVIRTERIEF